ncbi:MAG: hypothetical protein FH761_12245 [Firmicutes bacterium]|nr:hypothetical protein [Bacillota bacterium]
MRQRVVLIKALANKPDILLDELSSSLDYQTRLVFADEIGVNLKNERKTTLMVPHDIVISIKVFP